MAIKINIRKILSTTLWSCIGAGVLVLLVAAIRYRNSNTCKGYLVNITGSFITKKDIESLVTPAGIPRDRPIQSFDLRRLESTLEKNVWIRKARLFFDNNNVLHVDITGRTPATRVFADDGSSFYLDSCGVQLPLVTRFPSRLPVFTGYPAGSDHRDSLLLPGILRISEFIRRDSFWSAQIAQVNITAGHGFELEPEIGDHRICFGDGNDIAQKFHRLFLFYQQVLSRVGFDKYQRVDVSFAGQVVATRRGSGESRYDSLQGMNNIRELIRAAQHLQPDTIRQQQMRPLEHSTMTEQNLTNYDLLPGSNDSASSSINNKKTTKTKYAKP